MTEYVEFIEDDHHTFVADFTSTKKNLKKLAIKFVAINAAAFVVGAVVATVVGVLVESTKTEED